MLVQCPNCMEECVVSPNTDEFLCEHCGTELNICPECGEVFEDVTATPQCPSCGYTLSALITQCPNCFVFVVGQGVEHGDTGICPHCSTPITFE